MDPGGCGIRRPRRRVALLHQQLGAVVHVLGPDGVAALSCVSVASLLLLGQAALIRMYWNRSIAPDSGESSEPLAAAD
jgi:hypothetical protein